MNKRQMKARIQELEDEKAVRDPALLEARRELNQLREYKVCAEKSRQVEVDLLTLGLIPEEFIRPAGPVILHVWSSDLPKPEGTREGIREGALREAADLVRAASAQKLDKKRLKELETYRQESK